MEGVNESALRSYLWAALTPRESVEAERMLDVALVEAQAEQRQADVTKLKEAAKNQGGAFQCCALALLNMAEAIEAGGHK